MSPPVWVLLTAWHAGASAASFAQYALDKRAARLGSPRVPEKRLHLLDLLGGWPGGLLARRLFRHKTRKQPFAAVFWLTACIHAVTLAGALRLILTH